MDRISITKHTSKGLHTIYFQVVPESPQKSVVYSNTQLNDEAVEPVCVIVRDNPGMTYNKSAYERAVDRAHSMIAEYLTEGYIII